MVLTRRFPHLHMIHDEVPDTDITLPDTDIDKNGFYYNLQTCSNRKTQIPTEMQMGCKPILLVSVSASVNTPLNHGFTTLSLPPWGA